MGSGSSKQNKPQETRSAQGQRHDASLPGSSVPPAGRPARPAGVSIPNETQADRGSTNKSEAEVMKPSLPGGTRALTQEQRANNNTRIKR